MNTIRLSQIREDSALQPRENMKTDLVAEYAERMTEGDQFPPVVVFRSHEGGQCFLADGYHRVAAARQIGMVEIDADVHEGSKRDAMLYSVGANATHGERRTNADKRRAVMTLLEDDEWSKWSNEEIARRCSVSPHTVAKVRTEVTLQTQSDAPQQRTYTTKHGTTATMNTERIGRHDVGSDEEYERRRDEAFDMPDIGPSISADEIRQTVKDSRRVIEEQRQHEHLNLSNYADTANQASMFQAIERYINSFGDASRQLEATHNLIKKLKDVANQLQMASIGIGKG